MASDDSSEVKKNHRALAHAPQTVYPVVNNELVIGGTPVRELTKESAGKPFYAYDSKVITHTVEELRKCLPDRVKLHYAVKANPMKQVVHHLSTLTEGLDVASAQELKLVLGTSVAAEDISFAGPGKSMDDLSAAVEAGVIIVLESETEARRVAGLAAARGTCARCAVRVNPDFELKSSGMKMGGGSQQFGIDAEQVPAMLDRLADLPLDILGFHIFSGSQNLQASAIITGQQQTLNLAVNLAINLKDGLRWLNIGGGLGVPYFPGDEPLDIAAIAAALNQALGKYLGPMSDTEIVMELGRYLVAPAGVYVCTVTDKKVSRGTTYLITNGGLHHHLAATGNFGQVIRRNYPVAVANRVSSADREVVTIVGPLCTPLDLLGKDMDLPRAEIGDLIAVYMSGAYGYSASPQGFLSHPAPTEFFL